MSEKITFEKSSGNVFEESRLARCGETVSQGNTWVYLDIHPFQTSS